MKRISILIYVFGFLAVSGGRAQNFLVFEGKPANGKHVVFVSGDEEYRSEESLPQLAKILAKRHGFKCTVLFPLDEKGVIDPTVRTNLPGAESLDSADVIVMLTRFREWADPQMKHFVDAYLAGKPIIALRTVLRVQLRPGVSEPVCEVQLEQQNVAGRVWETGAGRDVGSASWSAQERSHQGCD